MPGFFGLKLHNRKGIFKEIFDLTFYGKGGFPYSEVYNMPIWMRKANISYINEHYTEQQKLADEQQLKNKTAPDIHKPNISPKS